jgi:hypothetical protein
VIVVIKRKRDNLNGKMIVIGTSLAKKLGNSYSKLFVFSGIFEHL